VFGMKPRSSRLVDLGMWFLFTGATGDVAVQRVLMPLGVRFQKPLALARGLIDTADVGKSCCCAARKPLERYVVFISFELARRLLAALPSARGGGLFRFPGTCVARPLPAAQICMRSATISVVVRSFPSLSCHLRVRKDPSI